MPMRALVLIDLQNDYFPGGRWPLAGIESAADNAAKVLAAARAAGDLVVHVRHEFPSADAPFTAASVALAEIIWRRCARGFGTGGRRGAC
jgi:nicotinamidase-related amidase